MRKYVLMMLLWMFSTGIYAQKTDSIRYFKWNLSAGGAISSFQDLKYSAVRYSGMGFAMGTELNWQRKGIHSVGIDGIISTENPKTFSGFGEYHAYRALIYYYYVHPVYKNEKAKVFVGARLNALDITWHLNNDLINNSSYMVYGTGLSAYSVYQRRLNDKWVLNAQLGFRLMGIMYEGMSYAYSTDQETLEKGNYNYDELAMPVSFNAFWDYLKLETAFHFSYGKRWTFSYLWRMEQSYVVEGYRMTMGYSAIRVSYNIMARTKKK